MKCADTKYRIVVARSLNKVCVAAALLKLAACGSWLGPYVTGVPEEGDHPADQTTASESPVPVALQDKLGTRLFTLVATYRENGKASALAYAKTSGVSVRGEQVAVRFVAESHEHADALAQRIEAAGGQLQSRFENNVFALLPIAAIEPIVQGDAVWRADLHFSTFAPPVRASGSEGAGVEPETTTNQDQGDQ